ncbi:anti-sigma regulatory factor [bacterium (candidate division B38) B3_B38]|nr:MAG: anti-sigma regulatory factor [bacterium (candidate division B38) B3_B38]
MEEEITFTVPIRPDMELEVTRVASSVAEAMRLGKDKIDEIKLALIEACLNAFEHSKSKEKKVHIKIKMTDDRLEIIVRDYGVGFDPSKVKEPKIEEKLKSPRKRGWGLKIMRSLMDSVVINSHKGGTKIIMTKRR